MADLVFDGLTICSDGAKDYYENQYNQLEAAEMITISFPFSTGRQYLKTGQGQTDANVQQVLIAPVGAARCTFYKPTQSLLQAVITNIETKLKAGTIGTLSCNLGTFTNMRIANFDAKIRYYGSAKGYGCDFSILFTK